MMDDVYTAIAARIAECTGTPFTLTQHRSIAGGCINRATLLEGRQQRYFLKLNQPALASMFEAEAQGLQAIKASATVRVPTPICWGTVHDTAFIVLEYVAMGTARPDAFGSFGSQLAQLHRTTSPRFGWHRDNTIGSTPQVNTYMDDWIEFLRMHRLGYQLQLAATNGISKNTLAAGEHLFGNLEGYFTSYTPAPSLLHGDLWSGNFSADVNGEPIVFDPAVYFGDREADLAMTELFGGFGSQFYESYGSAWPLDPGYKIRKTLYNLYHVLNHFNLFGGGYGAQAQNMIQKLLAEIN